MKYSLALVGEFSIASAGRAKRCRQSGPARKFRRGRIRVGRWRVEAEELEVEAGEERWRRRGRRRWPRG